MKEPFQFQEVSLDGFSIQGRRLQMETGIDHYSPGAIAERSGTEFRPVPLEGGLCIVFMELIIVSSFIC